MFKRALLLPKHPDHSFFLWGPRKTGKSSLLKSTFPGVKRIDLLDTDQFSKYLARPSLLREECLALKERFLLIDEIQKVPALLDEIHLLIEDHSFTFGLCGSSARKLKRGHANLLGGRAIRYELTGLTFPEMGKDFNIEKLLNRGYLPSHYLSLQYKKLQNSYINEYLKEEISAEGLVQNLPVFSEFLRAAAFSDTEIVNYTNIARDCGVSSPTVKSYFQILQDTLVGHFLPAYTKRPKRKIIHAPKFYFFDVAITNVLTRRSEILPGSELWGKAFENWVYHELRAYIHYKDKTDSLTYWKLADSGKEVDFVINDVEIAIEVKSSNQVKTAELQGLHEIKIDHPQVKKRILVSMEKTRRLTNGILIVPYFDFVKSLWEGEWF